MATQVESVIKATRKLADRQKKTDEVSESKSSSRFVYELAIVTRNSDLDEIQARLDVARRVYNALLSEALKRVDLMRESRDFRRSRGIFGKTVREWKIQNAALVAEKAKPSVIASARKAAWTPYNEAKTAIRMRFDLRGSYSLGYFATTVAQSMPLWAAGHGIGAQVVHALSARAWIAIDKYLTALERGKSGRFARPKFLRMGETRSVEGVGSSPAIRLTADGESLIWAGGKNGGQISMATRWTKHLDAHDQHARSLILAGEIATTRLVVRSIRGIKRVYGQITLKGDAYREPELQPRDGISVGADLGFREVAYVVDDRAGIVPLSEDASRIDKELVAKRKRAQRSLDRSRRATNPGNYEANGTIKPRGKRSRWVKSAQYRAVQAELAEDQRRVAAIRKTETGRLLNTMLPLGHQLHIEDLSYSAWQRGRATAIKRASKPGKKSPHALRLGGATSRVFAPGEFASRARQKWTHYGGSVVDINAIKARLSQLCHRCGTYTAQPTLGLSVFRRVHECACGVEPVQADLYQAFLARFTSSQGDVDLSQARKEWAGAVTLLAAAGSTYRTRERGGLRAPSRPGKPGASECVAAESAPLWSQDFARRSGDSPRGAEGETDQASTIDHIERHNDAVTKQGRSNPVKSGKNRQSKSKKRKNK